MNATRPLESAVERALREALDARGDLWWLAEAAAGAPCEHPRRLLLPLGDRANVAVAVGLAWSGARVVVDVASSGRVPALIEVLGEAGRPGVELPARLVIRVPVGGELGPLDAPVLDLLAAVPGLRVVCPRDAATAVELLHAALGADGPVVLLEPRGAVPGEASGVPPTLDHALLLQGGRDLLLVGWGAALQAAGPLRAALAASGLDVGLVDLVSLAPLDHAGLGALVQDVGRVAVLVPGRDAAVGGEALAARVAQAITASAFWSLEAPVATLLLDAPGTLDASVAALLRVLDLLESP